VIDAKILILAQVADTPGIRYRELLRLTGLSNGALEYHLRILEKTNTVKVDRSDGNRARYYSIYSSTDESHIIGFIRNNVSRQIVTFDETNFVLLTKFLSILGRRHLHYLGI
jgi:predicted transcriptional regulator